MPWDTTELIYTFFRIQAIILFFPLCEQKLKMEAMHGQ